MALEPSEHLDSETQVGKVGILARYSHKKTAVTGATKQMCRMEYSSQTGFRKESG